MRQLSGRQTGRQTTRQAGRQAGKTDKTDKTDRQTPGRWADGQTSRQAGRQADGRTACLSDVRTTITPPATTSVSEPDGRAHGQMGPE
jgi:hypothetical protein